MNEAEVTRPEDPNWAPRRWGLPLLFLGLLVRLVSIGSEDAYLHPDALWQGLEPAFGVIWGDFEPSWEFDAGARSWLWPGVLALPMGLTKLLGLAGPGEGMSAAIFAARGLVAVIDLLACALLTRHLLRHEGSLAAGGVGVLLALHPAFVVMGGQPLIDVPAALSLVLCWVVCDRGESVDTPEHGHALAAGASVAFALMLRIQLAPVAFAAAGIWVWRQRARGQLGPALMRAVLAGLGVVVLFGALDWLTWGSWWHSLRTYLEFNLSEAGRSFGSMPADRYWAHAELAMPYLRWPLAGLALLGAWRRPSWALLLVAFWFPHQWLDYRVWRFIHPGLFILLVCAAAGFSELLERLEARGVSSRATRWMVFAGALVFTGSALRAGASESLWQTTWGYAQGGDEAVRRMRGINRAALWLSAQPDPGLTMNEIVPHAGAPGRALFGHAGPRIHTVGGPPPAAGLPTPGAWILPLAAEPGLAAAGLEVVWRDLGSGVLIARQRGG